VTAFYQRDVELLDRLGPVPPLTIVAVDEGGQVDTVTFNSRSFEASEDEVVVYARMLESMRRAFADGDLHEIGRIATRSALLHQRRLHKRWLEPVIRACEAVEGLGVVTAHSGTCLGVLLATEAPQFREQFQMAQASLRSLAGHTLVYQSRSC
jgi:L-threonine kinase